MPNHDQDEKDLVLDEVSEKFEAFQALRKADNAAADQILNSLGAQDDVDRDIILEVSSPRAIGHPKRFPEAHRLAVRALEVLDRNGGRAVTVSGLGPLSPIAGFLAQQVAQLIIRMHQSNLADHILHLYERREANMDDDDPHRLMVTRARIQMKRIAPGFKRNALEVPLFVVAGAGASTALRLVSDAVLAAFSSLVGKVIAVVVIGLVVAGLAWVVLRGAAVARRRITLTTDGPMQALWETVGRAGLPPQDPSRVFALIALIFALLPWVLIPLGIAVSWLTDLAAT